MTNVDKKVERSSASLLAEMETDRMSWESAGDHLPKPSDGNHSYVLMGSECRHAGRILSASGMLK